MTDGARGRVTVFGFNVFKVVDGDRVLFNFFR